MSFDIIFQAFADGEAIDANESAASAVLSSWVTEREPQHQFVRIETPDGGADVYGFGTPDGLMINHASGRAVWDVMFAVAVACGYSVLPPGCPTCVTAAGQRAHLPTALQDESVVVESGADLLRVVETA